MRVLAIDPGEKVGWATGDLLELPDERQFTLRNHGITDLKPFAVTLGEKFSDYDVVVYEAWRLYAGHAKAMVGNEMQTSQLIGIIRYLGWLNPDVKIVKQNATIKKTADKTAQFEFQKLIEREPGVHDDAHDIDAIRHLWFWYWKEFIKNGK